MRRFRFLAIVILAGALSAPGCLRGSYLARGEQALAAGHYEEAEIFFRKEIQARPRSVKAHYGLARILLQQGSFALASSELARVLDLDPSNEGALVSQGQLLLASGRGDEAEKRVRSVLSHNPRSLEAEVLLGEILSAQGKFDAARTQLEHAIADHPDRAAGYSGLAKLMMRQGLKDEALRDLDRAISAEPRQMDARLLKAKYLITLKRPTEAVTVVQAAVAADPKSDLIRLALGDAMLAAQRKNEAFSVWRSLASKGSLQGLACARLVIAELENEQISAAAADLKLVQDQAQRSQPDFVYAQARLLASQHQYREAVPLFVELTRQRPNFPLAFYYLGAAYLALGQYADANGALETSERLAPNVVETSMLLAALEFNRSEFPAAIAHLTRVLARDEKNVTAHMLMGDALMAEKHPDRAIDEYQRILQIQPDSAMAHERLGRLAMTRKDPKRAIDEFETALRLQPSLIDVTQELVQTLRETKGQQAALDRLRAQVRLQPKSAAMHMLLGSYLTRSSQLHGAIQEFETARAADPKLVGAYYGLARAYQDQGRIEDATKELEAALKQKPDYVPALMTLGAIADRLGDRKRAIGYYQKVLDGNPNFAPAANDIAWDYAVENRNLDEALDLAQRARQLAPKDPHVADTLGFVMLKRGVAAGALPLLRESVAALPDSEDIHYHLGLALLELHQPVEASSELSTALKLGPKSPDAGEISHALWRAKEELKSRQQKGNLPG